MSFSLSLQPLRLSARQLLRNAGPHAPHKHLAQGVAGPSRCFCTAKRLAKASELPLEELHYEALDDYRHQLPVTSDYWPGSSRATLRPAKRQADTSSLTALLERQNASRRTSTDHDFFTPSTVPPASHDTHTDAAPPLTTTTSRHTPQPLYIETLDPTQLSSLDERVQLLLRSGEHSLPSLASLFGSLTPSENEQVSCHILSSLITRSEDPRLIWDLYRSWPASPDPPTSLSPSGPTRATLRKLKSDTLYRLCSYIHSSGLTRQAALMVGDGRLKPSQSRFLLERLIYDVKPGKEGEGRLVVRELADAMMGLMADGVGFKRKVLNRMLKLCCLTGARSRVARLVRAAQRRAQLDLQSSTEATRAAGGFSRLRPEETAKPEVASKKVVEECIRLLCAQEGGGKAAYELLCALDPAQRTMGMYDALMVIYGNVSVDVKVETGGEGGWKSPDDQLWTDITTLPHLGPSLHTFNARIICHARTRRLDLIKTDLAFIRSKNLGTIHDLSESARLAIVRGYVENGSLLAGFRMASLLLSHDTTISTKLLHTLLRAAQHIRLPTPGPSRAQLLKRFLRHFSHLHKRHPELRADAGTLELFVRLLERNQSLIGSEVLWGMLRVVGRHFGQEDERLVGVLEAFQRVFEARGETASAEQLGGLVERLKRKQLES